MEFFILMLCFRTTKKSVFLYITSDGNLLCSGILSNLLGFTGKHIFFCSNIKVLCYVNLHLHSPLLCCLVVVFFKFLPPVYILEENYVVVLEK